jgi:hypothetical protein
MLMSKHGPTGVLRTDSCLSLPDLCKLNNTTALGAGAVKQDLSQLNLTRRFEQLDKIFIGS